MKQELNLLEDNFDEDTLNTKYNVCIKCKTTKKSNRSKWSIW